MALHSITAYTPRAHCPACLGEGLVCEEHPDIRWNDGDGCCGAPGAVCTCVTWACGSTGPLCACVAPWRPSWYETAKIRGREADRFAYWCRKVIAAIDRGASTLEVTSDEYLDLRRTLQDDADRRWKAITRRGELPDLDTEVVRPDLWLQALGRRGGRWDDSFSVTVVR